MRRIRIAILGASPCGQCTAACCRQNGHAYAALLQGEASVDSEARFASRQRLRSLLTECSEAELEAAILNRVDRMTQPEVAEVMGISERSVRRLLDRFDRATAALQEETK